MKTALLDPAIYFISQDKWNNPDDRNTFIKHLLDNLGVATRFNIAKLYWDQTFEIYFWSKQLTPWRLDGQFNNMIRPILYRLFSGRNIGALSEANRCAVAPNMFYHDGEIKEHFLCVMHSQLVKNEDIFLCLSVQNDLGSHVKYSFSCNCHSNVLTPTQVRNSKEWLDQIDVVDLYWPRNNLDDRARLGIGLDIIRLREYEDIPFLYSFSFSDDFISRLISVSVDKLNILEKMAMRLVQDQLSATRDGRLQDEPMPNNRRRFRVTQRPSSTRIHYRYIYNNKVEFLTYGAHDYSL
jgi:hypothetical protein